MKRSVSRIKSVSRRRKSVSRRRKSVSRRRKSVSRRRKSVSRRRKSVRRKSVSRRRKSVSRRRKSVSRRRKSVSRRRKSVSRRRKSVSRRIRKSVGRIRKSILIKSKRVTGITDKNDGMEETKAEEINVKKVEFLDRMITKIKKFEMNQFDIAAKFYILKDTNFDKIIEYITYMYSEKSVELVVNETVQLIATTLIDDHDYENFEKLINAFPFILNYKSLTAPDFSLFEHIAGSQFAKTADKDYTDFLKLSIRNNVNIYERTARGQPVYLDMQRDEHIFNWVKLTLLMVERELESELKDGKDIAHATPLINAINNNDEFMVRFLVSNRADIDIEYKGVTPRQLAKLTKNKAMIEAIQKIDKTLVIEDVCARYTLDYNMINNLKDKIIFIKSKYGSPEGIDCLKDLLFRLIIEISESSDVKLFDELFGDGTININIQNKIQNTPLMHLLYTQNIAGANKLVDMGADLTEIYNRGGGNALQVCLAYGDVNLVRKLLAKKYDVNAISKINGTSLLMYALNQKNPKYRRVIVKELLNSGANVNMFDVYSCTPLTLAISKGLDPDIVEEIINKSYENIINKPNSSDFTSLSYAISQHLTYAVKLLLDKGAKTLRDDGLPSDENANIKFIDNLKGRPPEIIDLVLDRTPGIIHNIIVQDPELAYEIIKRLGGNESKNKIKNKIIDVLDKHGNTPLIHVIKEMSGELIETILMNGADIDAPATNGYTPLIAAIYAYENNFVTLGDLFRSADHNTVVELGRKRKKTTALSIAIRYGYLNVVKWLLHDKFSIHPIEIRDADIKLAEADDSKSEIHVDSVTRSEILKLLLAKKEEQKEETKPPPSIVKMTPPPPSIVTMMTPPPPSIVTVALAPSVVLEKTIEMYDDVKRFQTQNFIKGKLVVTCYFNNDFQPSVHGLWPDDNPSYIPTDLPHPTVYVNQIFIVPSEDKLNSTSNSLTIPDYVDTVPRPYSDLTYLSAFKEELPGFLNNEWTKHGVYAQTGETIDDYFATCFRLSRPVIEILVDNYGEIDLLAKNKRENDIPKIIFRQNLKLQSCFDSVSKYYNRAKYCLDLKFNVCAFEENKEDGVWVWKFVDVSKCMIPL